MHGDDLEMDIKGIDHIAINTSDFSKSVEFYENILKFKRLQTVNCGDFDITYFELPGGSRLALFDYHGKNKKVKRDEGDTGLRHLAFCVDYVYKLETELKKHNVKIILPTTELENLGVRVLLFLGPDDEVIEFCERL